MGARKILLGLFVLKQSNRINSLCNVIEDAVAHAQALTQEYYGLFEPPQVKIIGSDKIKSNFMYVPSHLHHMLFELLKNSMRAVVERNLNDKNDDDFPEIKLVVAEGLKN